ncbi:molybdopterin-dependent oxidoreductase [Paradevosia shaoguanensis]|uniref:Molybdopterin-dependent oxidoreductase n=1 Tax=Paradevosia shaoguanensis TaxID=1335043 RepID=A0AA41QNN7_9HYPH|nr:molybdopterin-dependent oxidoreductase [Paradevosia shaoguanensis]MCI0127532.1 molybdopterin-dependent oxidoreductase [Paradevosia shaoguanensis]
MGIWLSILFMATPGFANDLAAPTGPVLLTVTGELGKTNDSKSARFDEAMLAALPQHRIETSTPWTDGKKAFEGVLISDLFDFLGVRDAQTLRAVALNEYEIASPFSEAIEHGALLAMRMDGKPLTRRDKGPIWIVYPRDGSPRIQDERHDARWVWQLTRIEIQ